MADLSPTDRDRVARFFNRQGATIGSCAFTKPDLVAAVAATDNWIDDNTADFNVALPQPFRNAATLQQKTLLFCWVALRRAGLLRVEEDG